MTRSHVLLQLLRVCGMLGMWFVECSFSTLPCLWDTRMCFFNQLLLACVMLACASLTSFSLFVKCSDVLLQPVRHSQLLRASPGLPLAQSANQIFSICKSAICKYSQSANLHSENIPNLQISANQIFSICKSAICKYSQSANLQSTNILNLQMSANQIFCWQMSKLHHYWFYPFSSFALPQYILLETTVSVISTLAIVSLFWPELDLNPKTFQVHRFLDFAEKVQVR